MIEKEMGYRGSKSDDLSVKEQRVDGNGPNLKSGVGLRCILGYCESSILYLG